MVEKWMSKYDVLRAFIAGEPVSNPKTTTSLTSSFPGILWYNGLAFALRINSGLIVVRDLSQLTNSMSLVRNTLVSMSHRDGIEIISLGSEFFAVAIQFQYGNIRSRNDILAELV